MATLDVVTQVQDRRDARGPVPVTRSLVSPRARELVHRADAELLAAQYSSEAWEQFSHAHLAAVRAGAAVVASRAASGGRRAPRTVWAMLHEVAPELDEWSEYFAAGASARAAVEAGRFEVVSGERAEQTLCAAEDFVDEVRRLVLDEGAASLGEAERPAARTRGGMLAVRAS
ncbi:SAV_6107 family HEPN domain-containing protein [Cellulomonas edaphi]|uniref:SAV_6107 family HEPN domain-containing protein n=1 Tax=Cellulomonas edaphi TaxID=3053468 RepID=A0ABT7S8T2_9CELL|nr:SAV_6107 family HEPN domain-containing protein [Cellulomons edaphi]MDM7832035.1 SAV_6107 family HEPN domain-containing protein [Cellulomons edaphi]